MDAFAARAFDATSDVTLVEAPRSRSREVRLTRDELAVLASLAEGLPRDEIALQLAMSPATLKRRVASVVRKLGARNRTQAIAIAVRNGAI